MRLSTLNNVPDMDGISAGGAATMMRFDARLAKDLPPLAWVFSRSASALPRLIHGASVDVWETGFFEGCFAPGEANGAVEGAANVWGSGMVDNGDRWLFITPSHTLEALYYYRDQSGWSISNSLPLLFASRSIPLPWNSQYGRIFATACRGIDDYERLLIATAGSELHRLLYDNVEVEDTGAIRLVRKPLGPRFENFEQYVTYLRGTLAQSFADAAKPTRRVHYTPLATCSTGYDSACAAAIAAQIGCGEAVTLRTSRGGGDDCGSDIGRRLGLHVHEVDRVDRIDGSPKRVAAFFAGGMGGEDCCYHSFGPLLQRRILLTGFHGDHVWTVTSKPNAVLARKDLSGASLQELRLQEDFIHIPVPMIGARQDADIGAISKSAEMKPYRLNNGYDRPIPRRVLEEAGIARCSFGQRKSAVSLHVFLDDTMITSEVRAQLLSRVPRWWRMSASCGYSRIEWETRRFMWRIARRLGQMRHVQGPIAGLQRLLVKDWRVFEHSRPASSLLFAASLLTVADCYRSPVR